MKRIVQCFVFALVLALCFSQLAFAETAPINRHFHVKVIPGTRHSDTAPAANLYGVAAYFGAEPLNTEVCDSAGTCHNVNPWNGPYPGNGTTNVPNDFWPCFGNETAEADCTYVGETAGQVYTPSSATSLPSEVVMGGPAYTFYLSANTATSQPYGCDATTTGDTYHMCAQAINFYEDDSGDTADDLVWSIEVEQGTSIIYDSGTQDYGPNPYGSVSPAATIVFYEDLNFGIPNGGAPNADGPCFASYNYPSNTAGPGGNYEGLANTFEGYFGISAGKTCVAPTSGLATVTITTKLVPEKTWAPENVLADCPASTMGGPPNSSKPYCYKLTFGTPTHTLTQKFNIWLE